MPEFNVTLNCVWTARIEANDAREAEAFAREECEIGDAVIVWAGAEQVGEEEEEAA